MSVPAVTVAVAASGGGSNLQAIIDAIAAGTLPLRIAVVLSDQPQSGAVSRAIAHAIPVCAIPYPKKASPAQRIAWEAQALAVVACFHPTALLLSGFMRILSAQSVESVAYPLLNQHPALLPDDAGATYTTTAGHVIPALRGAHVVRDALTQQLPVTGCTIHRVVPAVDAGPVIARAEVPILAGDDEASLHARIRAAEQPLLIQTLRTLFCA
jgi:phosphoribosylglycinamide formyltransferase-1